mmetsp:Transcript_105922/g.299452  ORF Transcript_105922/g.299452 Transcript_105922/m.299452 type:complete len:259 (-) Transcript_105922:28-804(-)
MAARSGESRPLLSGQRDDPFGVPWTSLLEVNKAPKELRLGFVRKVYGILAMQLLLTVAVAAPLQLVGAAWLQANQWLLWVSMAMSMVLICALSCNPELARQYPANEVLLFGFTIFEGVLVGFASAAYSWQSVILAAGTTAAIVVGLTVYAFFTKTDFTGFGPYLFGALLTACVFGLVLAILASCGIRLGWMLMLLDLACIFIFIMYIIYDTQLMLGDLGGHEHQFSLDDYVFAALTLYLDIVNLFLHILRLLGDTDGA